MNCATTEKHLDEPLKHIRKPKLDAAPVDRRVGR